VKSYRMTLNKKNVKFRELNLGEWGVLRGRPMGNLTLYAGIVECALLHPAYADLRPGEILFLGEKIFQLSSKFADDKEIASRVSDIKKDFEDSIHVIPALICRVFPAYTPEMIMAFDFDTLVIRLAQVQWMSEQDNPSPAPEGMDHLQAAGHDRSKSALDKALREAQRRK